jgi:voltage-gated potassium channel
MENSGTKLKLYLSILAFIIAVGTVVFAHLENLSLLDAFYFSIVTIATVGYGDIHPSTVIGKLVAIALIIIKVGTFLEVIAGITQVMIKRREKEIRNEKLNMIVGLFFAR